MFECEDMPNWESLSFIILDFTSNSKCIVRNVYIKTHTNVGNSDAYMCMRYKT